MHGQAAAVRGHARLVQRALQLRLVAQQQRQGLRTLHGDIHLRRRIRRAVDANLHLTQLGRLQPQGHALSATRGAGERHQRGGDLLRRSGAVLSGWGRGGGGDPIGKLRRAGNLNGLRGREKRLSQRRGCLRRRRGGRRGLPPGTCGRGRDGGRGARRFARCVPGFRPRSSSLVRPTWLSAGCAEAVAALARSRAGALPERARASADGWRRCRMRCRGGGLAAGSRGGWGCAPTVDGNRSSKPGSGAGRTAAHGRPVPASAASDRASEFPAGFGGVGL